MVFAKATGYGIRALAYLASQSQERLCGLREIAEHEHIPPVYLRKVLGELRRHRLLRTVKGIHGGYKLARAPQSITLWEVFRLLEPEPELDACILGHGICDPECCCTLHADWQHVRNDLIELLQKRTISYIAAPTMLREGEEQHLPVS